MKTFLGSLNDGLNDYISALDKVLDLDIMIERLNTAIVENDFIAIQDTLDKLGDLLSGPPAESDRVARRILELTSDGLTILKLIDHSDSYVSHSSLKLLQSISLTCSDILLKSLLAHPETVSFLVLSVEKFKAVYVRNECILLLSSLIPRSSDLQTILSFQGGVEALLSVAVGEGADAGEIPSKAVKCVAEMCGNAKVAKYIREAGIANWLADWIAPGNLKSEAQWAPLADVLRIGAVLSSKPFSESTMNFLDLLINEMSEKNGNIKEQIIEFFSLIVCPEISDFLSERISKFFLYPLPSSLPKFVQKYISSSQFAIDALVQVGPDAPLSALSDALKDERNSVIALQILTVFAASGGAPAIGSFRQNGHVGLLEIVINHAIHENPEAIILLIVWLNADKYTRDEFVVRTDWVMAFSDMTQIDRISPLALFLLLILTDSVKTLNAISSIVATSRSVVEASRKLDNLEISSFSNQYVKDLLPKAKHNLILAHTAMLPKSSADDIVRVLEIEKKKHAAEVLELKRRLGRSFTISSDKAGEALNAERLRTALLESEISRMKIKIECMRLAFRSRIGREIQNSRNLRRNSF